MANTINKVIHNGTEYEIKDTTYSAGTWISVTWTTIANTWVTTVNGNSWAVTVQPTLVSWTNIKTVNGTSLLGSGNLVVEWWLWLSSQANNVLTTGAKIWAGTDANYEALTSYDDNTVYLTYSALS